MKKRLPRSICPLPTFSAPRHPTTHAAPPTFPSSRPDSYPSQEQIAKLLRHTTEILQRRVKEWTWRADQPCPAPPARPLAPPSARSNPSRDRSDIWNKSLS
ncbi:hypothetical protein E2C01_037606 [Portunus trituberculatus]|uniref:Uncharacterized protein n=1 Tax=Portunus trituberculatus TaxID=210409 RepID=A0A5B7FG31_PORTR|nr:hypothetical protein [Portunus trituberculatus]